MLLLTDLSDLSDLSNDDLELLAHGHLLAGDVEAEEACLLEMLRRDFWPAAWIQDLLELAD